MQAISLAKCENRCHETESGSYTDKRCFFLKENCFFYPQYTVVHAMNQVKCENKCHETESLSYTDKPCHFKEENCFIY